MVTRVTEQELRPLPQLPAASSGIVPGRAAGYRRRRWHLLRRAMLNFSAKLFARK